MKKFISVLTILFSLVTFSHAMSFKKTDLKAENLKGPVKTVKTYDVVKAEYFHADTIAKYKRLNLPLPEFEKTLLRTTDYNPKGMIVCDNWKYSGKTVINFNPRNRNTLLFSEEKNYNSDGSLRRVYKIIQDGEGLPLLGIAVNEKGDTIFKEGYYKKYFDDGKWEIICTHTSYNMFPSNTSVMILRPNLTIEKLTSEKGDKIEIFELDEEERPISVSLYDEDDELIKITEIEYLPKETNFYIREAGDKRYLASSHILDKNGNPIGVSLFDKNGNLTSSISTIYFYDNYGNWIKKIVYENSNQNGKITEREISYY